MRSAVLRTVSTSLGGSKCMLARLPHKHPAVRFLSTQSHKQQHETEGEQASETNSQTSDFSDEAKGPTFPKYEQHAKGVQAIMDGMKNAGERVVDKLQDTACHAKQLLRDSSGSGSGAHSIGAGLPTDATKNKTMQYVDKAKHQATELKEKAQHQAEDVADKAKQMTDKAQHNTFTKKVKEVAKDTIKGLKQTAEHVLEDVVQKQHKTDQPYNPAEKDGRCLESKKKESK